MRKSKNKLATVAPRRRDEFDPKAPFDFRWTAEDLENGVPERFYAALKIAGAERGPMMRALARCWTEEIEEFGYDLSVKRSVQKCIGVKPEVKVTCRKPKPK